MCKFKLDVVKPNFTKFIKDYMDSDWGDSSLYKSTCKQAWRPTSMQDGMSQKSDVNRNKMVLSWMPALYLKDMQENCTHSNKGFFRK